MRLAIDDQGVDDTADIVHGDVTRDGREPRLGVNLDFAHLSTNEVGTRATRHFAWCIGLLGVALLIGLLPAMLIFLIGYMRFEGRESWLTASTVAAATWAAWYVLFHQVLKIPWPTALLGDWIPALRSSNLTNLL